MFEFLHQTVYFFCNCKMPQQKRGVPQEKRGRSKDRKGSKESPEVKPPRMSREEKRLTRQMHFDQGKTPSEIAGILDRHISSITRTLAQKKVPKPVGAPKKMTEKLLDRIAATLEDMIEKADACYEVSLAMVIKRCRVKLSGRTVMGALHKRGYWFRALRSKMILTLADVVARWNRSKKYLNKSREWWLRHVHIHLDNHHFKVATTTKGRKLLAKRTVRGAYR